MTLSEIQTLLVSADPNIKHYFSMGTCQSYSYWEEIRRLPFTKNDKHEEGWRFAAHLYTKTEGDPLAASIFQALDDDIRVSVTWQITHEAETGYIHHVFDCEGF